MEKKKKLSFKNPKLTCAEDIDKVAIEYFNRCIEEDKYPTVTGFCFELGIDRHTFLKYENCLETGAYKCLEENVKKDMVTSIKRWKAYIESQYEDRLLNDGRSPVGALFLLKNNYGYVDKQEIEQTNKTITVDIEEE